MSTNHTPNFSLCQWEADDKVLRSDFNQDNQKIDAALGEIRGALPRIALGSYTGTNEYGEDHPNSLTFEFSPKMVVIAEKSASGDSDYTIMLRGQSVYATLGSAGTSLGRCQWADNTLTWSSDHSVSTQFNYSTTYIYFAIG